jgi:hypothetical protein
MRTLHYCLAAVLVLLCGSARAAAILNFSGGNGTPLTLTLSQPVAYTITSSTPTLNGPWFVFQNVGNVFGGGFDSGSSTITYSINGGSAQSLTSLANNLTPNPTDLTILGTQTGATAGDIVRLNAGTFTTNGNVAVAPPTNGSYDTFVIDNNGTQHSGLGVTVPEPQSAALLAMGLLFRRRRGRKSHWGN